MDIVLAIGALIFLLPLLLLVGLIVKLDSPGPIFFRQKRGGLDGRPFTILKFRTMRVTDEESAVVQATKNDERVTRIGIFLRKTSIDELPQLLNVLHGEMSVVGPRPHAVVHDQHYGNLIPHYSGRTRTRPGLTGLAQVSGARGETATLEDMFVRINLDNDYVDEWTLGLDLKIIALTVVSLPFHTKAY